MLNNSSIDLIGVFRRIIAPLLLLLGVILIVSGILNASSTTEIITLNNQVITTYPRFHVGILISVVGSAIAIFSYLVFHGKIKLQKNHISVN